MRLIGAQEYRLASGLAEWGKPAPDPARGLGGSGPRRFIWTELWHRDFQNTDCPLAIARPTGRSEFLNLLLDDADVCRARRHPEYRFVRCLAEDFLGMNNFLIKLLARTQPNELDRDVDIRPHT